MNDILIKFAYYLSYIVIIDIMKIGLEKVIPNLFLRYLAIAIITIICLASFQYMLIN